MCLNSVVDLENYFLQRLGQQEFTENIKQQSKHDMLSTALPVLELF